jgi:hypothetical protein
MRDICHTPVAGRTREVDLEIAIPSHIAEIGWNASLFCCLSGVSISTRKAFKYLRVTRILHMKKFGITLYYHKPNAM